MNIFEEKILYDSVEYACRQLHLELVQYISDSIGKKGAILKDKLGRRYLFACKRYMFFRKNEYGIISFTKQIVQDAIERKCRLMMLIEDKDEENVPKNYLYTFNPIQILEDKHSFTNLFNEQEMINFDICLALNMEESRRREITETRVLLKEKMTGEEKDSVTTTLRRFF